MSERHLSNRLRHLRVGLLASASMLAVGPVVAALVGGWPAGVGYAAGVGLVAASFTGTSVALAWADSVNPTLVLPVGLTAYVLKFSVLGVAFVALAGSGWAGLPAFAVAVIVGTIGWATAQAWWTWHAKIPYVDV